MPFGRRTVSVSGPEPPALHQCIDSLSPDDGWLGSDLEEGQGDSREIRYINLQAHPALRAIDELESEALRLGDRAAFIIREEYRLFMQHAISCLRDGHGHWTHFFVTGQSGIGKSKALSVLSCSCFVGKSFGRCYILFYLLAQSSTLLPVSPRTTSLLQVATTETLHPTLALRKTIQKSWVVIDIPGKDNWIPPMIVKRRVASYGPLSHKSPG
ncbi:hypothetical protein CPB85DRAFT_357257 [Mucidula mucida]|nr:hypothetical protein CPB85DRAFT_357257 [Mucidula mucida]